VYQSGILKSIRLNQRSKEIVVKLAGCSYSFIRKAVRKENRKRTEILVCDSSRDRVAAMGSEVRLLIIRLVRSPEALSLKRNPHREIARASPNSRFLLTLLLSAALQE